MSPSLRVKFFLTGVLFPLGCVVCALIDAPDYFDEPWQSGRLKDFAILLLRWPTLAAFFPAMAISMACMTVWTYRPSSSQYHAVRWGIYSSVPLAIFFLAVILLTTSLISLVAAAFLGPALALIVYAVKQIAVRAKRFTILHLMVFTLICATTVFFAQLLGVFESLVDSVLACGLVILIAAPTLNLITYVRATVMILREAKATGRASSIKNGVGWLAFLGAYGGSTRVALALLLDEYAKLPTTDPNCYLSNAAAHRHKWLCGGSDVPGVTRQTKRLKFLELVVRASAPRMHRRVRQAYDRFGPPLARVCRANRWFADATYLMFVPLEGLSESLRLAIGIPATKVRGLYRGAIRPRHGIAIYERHAEK